MIERGRARARTNRARKERGSSRGVEGRIGGGIRPAADKPTAGTPENAMIRQCPYISDSTPAPKA